MTMKQMESVLGRYFRSKSAKLEFFGKKGMWTVKAIWNLEGFFGSRDQVVAGTSGKTRKESLRMAISVLRWTGKTREESLRNMAASVLRWNGKGSLEELELEMDTFGIGVEGRK